ncbi:MAG: InlB B-repeat-containing protein [Alphaproteobacteria bacterium]|nr:InlB B-repeat-containing protein [Alphaproteobacteria bacterium]
MKRTLLLTSIIALTVGSAFADDPTPGDNIANIGANDTTAGCNDGVLLTSDDGATVYLKALWEPKIYTITLDDSTNGGSGGSGTIYEKYNTGWYSNSSATTGNEITNVTIPTKSGAVFTGYFSSTDQNLNIPASGVLPSNTTTFDDNNTTSNAITLYANYQDCAYTDGEHSHLSTATIVGNACQYTVTCDAGYNHNGEDEFQFTGGAAAATGTATGCETPNTITLSWNTDGGSANPTAPATCNYGTTFNVPTVPTKKGYTFDGWDVEEITTLP